MEFLRGRKFRVVANGCMSREEDVISGVPQGTVLADILFVITISDSILFYKFILLTSPFHNGLVS